MNIPHHPPQPYEEPEHPLKKIPNLIRAFFLLGVVLFVISIPGVIRFPEPDLEPITPQICCNSTCFDLELAQTPAERQR